MCVDENYLPLSLQLNFETIMYFTGLIIGVATFFIIGLFHPLVIKGEYYFGTRIWWVFALM